jgi:DNA (cytosine-5)-methyltransferase 3A
MIDTQGINVLSLCDGMSCGQIALKNLGIEVNKYYAFEIKQSAIDTTRLNFPNTIELGDIHNFNSNIIQENIDLLLCGFPCQNLSFANKTTRNGLQGDKSSLFFKCVEILNTTKPKYFLFENVASMKNVDRDLITETLGVEPIKINSALVSAQTRNRYYWTNIPNVTQPIDKNISLRSIIDVNAKPEEKMSDKKLAFIKRLLDKNSIYIRVDGEKSMPITARSYASWNTQYVTVDGIIRDLTIDEYRQLQTIPNWYRFENLIKSKIIDLIGDGWTVDVISHILSFAEF